MDSLQKTPLYEMHLRDKGKIINFAGWALPERYQSIIGEHEAVRSRAGIFDVSHMGKVTVRGAEALDFLQKIMIGDVGLLEDRQALYSMMCYPDGGVVDDILVYRFGPLDFFLVLNAANTDKDYRWLEQNNTGGAVLKNCSADFALMALQGPLAEKILQSLTDADLKQLKFFHFFCDVKVAGITTCLLSRTGYTGEDGFEIYIEADKAPALWHALLSAGTPHGLVPAGLGARDSLRLEACLPLYGHELTANISPIEAGLGKFIKFEKTDFIGRAALAAALSTGTARKLVGFIMEVQGVPRAGYVLERAGKEIGFVTSGGYAPTLKKNIGLALIKVDGPEQEDKLDVVIRGKRLKAAIVPTPFYKKRNRNK